MPSIQITLVQIDNYGPWTVTPAPRGEMDLQTLQSRLYADLAGAVGTREGYLFYTRFDNMVAVTNGIDREAHRRIQESINTRYPVSVSVGVGTAASPAEALGRATDRLQRAGSAQSTAREGILDGEFLPEEDRGHRDVQVAHFDVVDSTSKYTDRVNAFDAHLAMEEAHLSLARHMREAHDSLSFFVGGDNVIAVCPDLDGDAFERAVEFVRDDVGVELQVGVGRAASASEAGMAAKHALEECRHNGTRVEGTCEAVSSD
ncbi:GTP cyclohydrolase IIa [Halobacteriales archaeon QS_8_69_26]|nr:MAG: GTP cyclohydrolase IIa [Halobacteriales archaeon QS_8_69_26]